ncbi:GNAT family N-acetyltransferase [Flavivirga amylovorans]|uniref:GNAT family N-acetyltransferase n=1 Tax=Flavivirga amylovorans TaxID=870486 RepID=A0ABT8WZP5_9FLAO|nr:GNAT family N-acetyltransferase [Flavivirga amylovorans]MDO5987153.1 GNAT family N-acetyltransferase [Flavivirga amylovorans]
MIIAETERLIISEFTIEDAPFFLELANTPNALKYIGDKNLKSIEDAEKYLTNKTIKSYHDFNFGFYKLELKEEKNKSIGTCGLAKRRELEDVDLGFAFLPEYEGRGFGSESSKEMMTLAKQTFKLDKLIAITVPYNKNSIKLLEKLGFACEKRIKPFEDDEELLLFAKKL